MKVLPLVIVGLLCLGIGGCGGGSDQKSVAESHIQALTLLMLQTGDADKTKTFPDMSSPDAMKTSFQKALGAMQAGPNGADWSDDIFTDPLSSKSYVVNKSLSKASTNIPEPDKVVAFYAPEATAGQRLVCYVDAHTEWVDENQWPGKKAAGSVDKPLKAGASASGTPTAGTPASGASATGTPVAGNSTSTVVPPPPPGTAPTPVIPTPTIPPTPTVTSAPGSPAIPPPPPA